MTEQHSLQAKRPRWSALWITLGLLLALGVATRYLYEPPAPLPDSAPAAEFSAQRAVVALGAVLGDQAPHPLASHAAAQLRTRIVQRLEALGLHPELQDGWVCDTSYVCGRVVNIVTALPGQQPASGSVLLAAHYDSVPAGPGAGDDGVGVAAVLEIARQLSEQPPALHPVTLLIDEGEEAGLLGARLYVASHPSARAVRAAVNLDARGDTGPSLMFETGAATDWSLRLFAGAARRPLSNSLYYFIYKLLPNDTDFTVFKAAGYQGFNFALIGGVQRYHTPQDTLANLDLRSLQHQGENALAMTRALAAADLSQAPPGSAVFFDVGGRALLHWPARWATPLGLLLFAAVGFAAWQLKRRSATRAQTIFQALGALLGAWLGATIVAAALLTLLRWSGAVPPAMAYSWSAGPGAMHAAFVALALLVPAAAARLIARRDHGWALWLANAGVIAALTLASSLLFPELSFLFVVPALGVLLAAALALRPGVPLDGAHAVPGMTAALPVLLAAAVWAPSLLLTYTALGTDAWPIITATVALVSLGLAPLLAAARPRSARAYVLLALVTLLAGSGVSLLLPTYTAQSPQRTLRWYALDADTSRAQWLQQADSKRLPPEYYFSAALTAGTSGATSAALPTANADPDRHATPAATLALPPPELQWLAAERRGAAMSYRLRVRSARGAPEIELAFPAALGVTTVTLLVDDQQVTARPWRAPDGITWLKLIGADDRGIELQLETAAAGSGALTLLDRSYGLPAAPAQQLPARNAATTASQDGDLSIVRRSVTLTPTLARGENAPQP